MNSLTKFAAIAPLLFGFTGCAGPSAEELAADARDTAADARAGVEVAEARLTAADARIRVADAAVVAEAKSAQRGVEIPSGTVLKVALIDGLDSGANNVGDHFLATLTESVVVNGATVLERGTTIRGRVVDVESSGRVSGLARLHISLTDIVRGGVMVPITTGVFSASANSTQTRDAKVVAGTTAAGAVIGAITGGTKGVGIGAATGAGAGTGVVLATRGDEVHYSPETRFDFTLTNSVTL